MADADECAAYIKRPNGAVQIGSEPTGQTATETTWASPSVPMDTGGIGFSNRPNHTKIILVDTDPREQIQVVIQEIRDSRATEVGRSGGPNRSQNYFEILGAADPSLLIGTSNMDPRTKDGRALYGKEYEVGKPILPMIEEIFGKEPNAFQKALETLRKYGRYFKRIINTLGSRKVEMAVFNRALAEQDLIIVTRDNAKIEADALQKSLNALNISDQQINEWAAAGTPVLIVGEGAGRVFPELVKRGVSVTAVDSWYGDDLTNINQDLTGFQSQFQSRLKVADPLTLENIPANTYPVVISFAVPNEHADDTHKRVHAAFRVTAPGGKTLVRDYQQHRKVRVTRFMGHTYFAGPNKIEIQKMGPLGGFDENEPVPTDEEIPAEVREQMQRLHSLRTILFKPGS